MKRIVKQSGAYYWVDQYGLLRGIQKEWEFDKFGFYPYGAGDGCWRLGLAVIAFGYRFLVPLVNCLKARVRYLGPPFPVINGKVPYNHPRKTFSRDQWIPGWAALFLLDYQEELKNIKIPWRLSRRYYWTPDLLFWVLYLKYGKKIYKKLYHLFGIISTYFFTLKDRPKHKYVLHLASIMVYCAPNKIISNLIMKRMGNWNLLLRVLNNRPVTLKEIEKFVDVGTYAWQGNNLPNGKPLPENDPFPLSKNVLLYFYNRKRPC